MPPRRLEDTQNLDYKKAFSSCLRAFLVAFSQLRLASVASLKFVGIRPALHPSSTPTRLPRWGPRVWLRCSSLKYSRYSHSSRLAIRAHRRPRCTTNFRDATLADRMSDGVILTTSLSQ